MNGQRRRSFIKTMLAAAALAPISRVLAQTLQGSNLVSALRQGGFILVMRHADSPAQPPAKTAADPRNVKLERELDSGGREKAQAMGAAVRALRIPIGDVFSSPTFRAHQTVELAGLGQARDVNELDEGATGMQTIPEAARIAWLKAKIGEAPRPGTNTILVTHAPNIKGAFNIDAAAGETIAFKPDGHGGANEVARIKIGDWTALPK